MPRDERQRHAVRFADRLPAQTGEFSRLEGIHGRRRVVGEFHRAERGEETVVADIDDGSEVGSVENAIEPLFEPLVADRIVVETHLSGIHKQMKAADAYNELFFALPQVVSFNIRVFTCAKSVREKRNSENTFRARAGVEFPVGIAHQSDENHFAIGGFEVVKRAKSLQPVIFPVIRSDIERRVVLVIAIERQIPSKEQTVRSRTHRNRKNAKMRIGNVGQIHRRQQCTSRTRVNLAAVRMNLAHRPEK